MIECRDLHHCELPVVFHGGFGIDHVPVRGERRIVELQHQARLDDGPVLFAHCIGRGEQEFLVGLVVGVADPRGAAGGDGGHEALLDARRFERRLEVGDVGLDCIAADIAEWAHAHGACCWARACRDSGFGIGIRSGKSHPVAAIGETRQHGLSRAGAPRRHVVHVGPSEIEAAQTVIRVAHPCAVVDAVSHGLAELAVARDIDTEFCLAPDDLRHGGAQVVLKCLLVARFARFTRPVRRYQVVRARQAADMRGEDAIGAGSHDGFLSAQG